VDGFWAILTWLGDRFLKIFSKIYRAEREGKIWANIATARSAKEKFGQISQRSAAWAGQDLP
jgi:hypothetical protein